MKFTLPLLAAAALALPATALLSCDSSGIVDSERNVRRAGELAASVKGVSSVKNSLMVK